MKLEYNQTKNNKYSNKIKSVLILEKYFLLFFNIVEI